VTSNKQRPHFSAAMSARQRELTPAARTEVSTSGRLLGRVALTILGWQATNARRALIGVDASEPAARAAVANADANARRTNGSLPSPPIDDAGRA
jgi:hypothetical protein